MKSVCMYRSSSNLQCLLSTHQDLHQLFQINELRSLIITYAVNLPTKLAKTVNLKNCTLAYLYMTQPTRLLFAPSLSPNMLIIRDDLNYRLLKFDIQPNGEMEFISEIRGEQYHCKSYLAFAPLKGKIMIAYKETLGLDCFDIAIDEKRNRLFASTLFGKFIHVIDLKTMNQREFQYLPHAGHMSFSPGLSLLAVDTQHNVLTYKVENDLKFQFKFNCLAEPSDYTSAVCINTELRLLFVSVMVIDTEKRNGSIQVFCLETGKKIPMDFIVGERFHPSGIAFHPESLIMIVSDQVSNCLYVFQ
jgi:hypothetical protein